MAHNSGAPGCVQTAAATPAARAEVTTWERAEGRDGANQKRRCYQRRSGAPTRGTGPLRLALAGATRSGSAGVGSRGSRSAGDATPRPNGVIRQPQTETRTRGAGALLIVHLEETRIRIDVVCPQQLHHRRHLVGPIVFAIREHISKLA